LDEIKQQLENTIGTEELQQKLVRARSGVSESQSDVVSLSGEKRSLSGSLNRWVVVTVCFVFSPLLTRFFHVISFIFIPWIHTGLQNPYGYGNSQICL